MLKIYLFLLPGFIGSILSAPAQQPAEKLKLLEVRKIWDQAPHNAFTDLIRFNDRWICVFREGEDHVSPGGILRVITSTDGETWESVARISEKDMDLRDAKITLTPSGQLMLSGAGALHHDSVHTHQSLVWFSGDGINWTESYPVGDPDFWLWRTTWHNGKAWSMGYGCNNLRQIRLYKSENGKHFETVVENLYNTGYPNETSILFSGDTAFCLLRRDGEFNSGLIGVSVPPYTAWDWKDLGVRIGGPHMIQLPDRSFIAAVRLYEGEGWHPARTALCRVDPRSATLSELITLPSGGDTSYAGLALHDGFLWVSYYSSHEEKTAVYLAKVKIHSE